MDYLVMLIWRFQRVLYWSSGATYETEPSPPLLNPSGHPPRNENLFSDIWKKCILCLQILIVKRLFILCISYSVSYSTKSSAIGEILWKQRVSRTCRLIWKHLKVRNVCFMGNHAFKHIPFHVQHLFAYLHVSICVYICKCSATYCLRQLSSVWTWYLTNCDRRQINFDLYVFQWLHL